MIAGWLQTVALVLLLWGAGLLMWSVYRMKAIEKAALRERSYKKAMADAWDAQQRVATHVWRGAGMIVVATGLFIGASFV
jgi:hypothetical protein